MKCNEIERAEARIVELTAYIEGWKYNSSTEALLICTMARQHRAMLEWAVTQHKPKLVNELIWHARVVVDTLAPDEANKGLPA